jgi:hypothetical protein
LKLLNNKKKKGSINVKEIDGLQQLTHFFAVDGEKKTRSGFIEKKQKCLEVKEINEIFSSPSLPLIGIAGLFTVFSSFIFTSSIMNFLESDISDLK